MQTRLTFYFLCNLLRNTHLALNSNISKTVRVNIAFTTFLRVFDKPSNDIHNHVPNILRPFDGWANLPFTTSETKRDYYK